MSSDANSGTVYNFFDPGIFEDPYPLYKQLRDNDPVFWTDLIDADGWLLTRYEDCARVLSDRGSFGPGPRTRELMEAQFPEVKDFPTEIDYLVEISLKAMFVADPPYHTTLRGVGNRAFFGQPILDRYARQIESRVDILIDKLADKGEGDAVADFAAQVPFAMIDFFDFPTSDHHQIMEWIEESVLFFAGLINDAQTLFRVDRSLRAFQVYLEGFVAQKRDQPGEDVFSYMIGGLGRKHQLSDRDLAMVGVTIFGAGHVTLVDNIAMGIEAFLRHPDQLKLLLERPELMENALEEVLRFSTPQQILNRKTEKLAVFGERSIPAGQMVFTVLAAANRDPEIFPEPNRFDITRENAKRHLASGHGPHFCLGARLSRIESEIAFRRLFQRFPDMRLAGQPRWRMNVFFRGLESLPVFWS